MSFGLPLALDDITQLLVSNTERFAQDKIAPLASSIDADNAFARELWPLMGQCGLHGITVNEDEGGVGLGYYQHTLIMEIISAASASVGLSYGAHSNLCINQLALNATPEQKQRLLPKLLSGEHVGALAMSEAGAGSDVMSMQCSAQQKDNHFVLKGTKMWITNGPDADVLIVYAKTGVHNDKPLLTAFIVEKKMPGFSTSQKLDKLGMRGSNTCELLFNDCCVPMDNVLGSVDQGASVLMRGLDFERVVLAAGPVGIMRACLNCVLPYVHERKQFGKAIGEFELMQGKLADMYTDYNACRSYLHTVAIACDNGRQTREAAASVILLCAEKATQMALQTIQCLGGNGYINEYPAGRLLRDAKLYEIGAGTSEIRRMLIGRAVFENSR